MAKKDQYHPDYEAIYPGIEKYPEILNTLKRSDRKMEYMEIDIKQETFVYNAEKRIARIQPSREDSYERLTESQYQFSSNDKSPEDEVLKKSQYDELHKVLDQLTSDERRLITICLCTIQGIGQMV